MAFLAAAGLAGVIAAVPVTRPRRQPVTVCFG
jgi:hypothetical protein